MIRNFLLGELRFYSRLAVITIVTILLIQHVVIPAVGHWADSQREKVVGSVTEKPKEFFDGLWDNK